MKKQLFIMLIGIFVCAIIFITPVSSHEIYYDSVTGCPMSECQSSGICVNTGHFVKENCSSGYASDYNSTPMYCTGFINGSQDYSLNNYVPYQYQKLEN